jgi:hypothetical protein
VAQRIHSDVDLRALASFRAVVACPRTTLGRRLQRATVDTLAEDRGLRKRDFFAGDEARNLVPHMGLYDQECQRTATRNQ